ncbi:MAG: hypothetical protein AABY74_04310, partial [Planctomycetota bacterium]
DYAAWPAFATIFFACIDNFFSLCKEVFQKNFSLLFLKARLKQDKTLWTVCHTDGHQESFIIQARCLKGDK